MELTTLRLDVNDQIATVVLDRPPVNAQNTRLRQELLWLFDTLSDRNDVRVIILTGSGQSFSAGADIKERLGLVQEPGDYIRHNRLTRDFFHCVADCSKPVICAVNGAAIGAGFALMSCCDILMMAEDSWVQMPELDVGLAGGAAFLLRHFSPSAARTMFYTGRRVSATELYRRGIIEACLPREALMSAAFEMARDIAAKSPVAMRKAKHAFNTVEEMPFRDGYRFEQGVTVELSHTEDAKEAQRAFVEKRRPVFQGR